MRSGFAAIVAALLAIAPPAMASTVSLAPFADPVAWSSPQGGPGNNPSRDADPGPRPSLAWTSPHALGGPAGRNVLAQNGVAYVLTSDASNGWLAALDVADGSERYDLHYDRSLSAPCLDGDSLYVSTFPSGVASYNLGDGSERWWHPGDAGQWCAATAAALVVETSDTVLTALNPATGALLWQKTVPKMTAQPVVAADRVVSQSSGGLYTALDLATGGPAWTQTYAGPTPGYPVGSGDLLAEGGTVYGTDEGGGLVALDAATGSITWSKAVSRRGQLAVDGARVYMHPIPDLKPVAYTRAGGGLLWSNTASSTFNGTISRGGAHLYVGNRAFDSATGAEENAAPSRDGTALYGGTLLVATDRLRAYRDVTPPTAGAQTPATFVASARPTLSWTAADDGGSGLASFDVVVDGAEVATALAADVREYVPTTDLAQGAHTWRLRAHDVAGNVTLTDPRAFTVDTVAPSAPVLTAPADGATFLPRRVTYSWQAATDATSGVDHYLLTVDGAGTAVPLPNCTGGTCTLAADVADGPHTWSVTSVDAAGNASATGQRSFSVDGTPPSVVTLTSPPDGARLADATPELTWAPATDGGSGLREYRLLVDGALAGTTTGTALSPALGEGIHEWSVDAVDVTGNVSHSATRKVRIDSVGPQASIAPPIATPVVGQTVTFDASGSSDPFDPAITAFEWDLDGDGTFETAGGAVQTRAYSRRGPVTVRLRVTNSVGQQATTSVAIDVRLSSVQLTGPLPLPVTRATSASFAFASETGTAFRCRLDGGAWSSCTSPAAVTGLAAGSHTFEVSATDADGNTLATPPSHTWTVDLATPPVAAGSASPSVAATGEPVAFDASDSHDALDGTITAYAWDLDGDGSFETATKTATRSYADPGIVQARLRVTNSVGGTAVTTVPVDVRRTPPDGRLGISINAGAQFTNDPEVTVSAVWPRLAQTMIVSNDGGFGDPFTGPVQASTAWTLDSSGPERLPKTVYVRFEGGESGRETYQDDIILDETAPTVDADVEGSGAGARGAVVSALRAFRLRVIAKDRTSGVAGVQVAESKARPGRFKAYKRKVTLRTAGRRAYVRARDRAGNVSRWRTVKLR